MTIPRGCHIATAAVTPTPPRRRPEPGRAPRSRSLSRVDVSARARRPAPSPVPSPVPAGVLAAVLGDAGVAHVVEPGFFDPLVPTWMPGSARWVTSASGVVEIAAAGLLAVPRTRRLAGWIALATLLAVYPANIQAALDGACGTWTLPSIRPPPRGSASRSSSRCCGWHGVWPDRAPAPPDRRRAPLPGRRHRAVPHFRACSPADSPSPSRSLRRRGRSRDVATTRWRAMPSGSAARPPRTAT